MYRLCAESEFSAAHYLHDYDGPCKRVHGHNWKVKVTVVSRDVDKHGMIMDLMMLKKMLDTCMAQYDHRLLNEVPPFDSTNPTLENLSRAIYEWLKKELADMAVLSSVEVFETDKFSVTYSPD
jgi:6-pyruvoyltetrahydropterin/6-carboxytetrahydropterin synthase